MQRPASFEELCGVAKKAISVFESSKISCCLAGDTACTLYGISRHPVELDIVVLTDAYPRENLERILTEADTDFYLVSPKDPRITYKLLCCKLSRRPGEHKRGCKVNIVIPRTLNIPNIPPDSIEHIKGLPVMPLRLLLFLKLQSWADRRDTLHHVYISSKQHNDDVKDISDLLVMVRSRGESVSREGLQWLPLTTVDAAMGRITEYVQKFPNSETNWRAVGYA